MIRLLPTLFAAVSAIGLSHSPLATPSQANCLSYCKCELHWHNQQTVAVPPSCYGSATFAFASAGKDGCCHLSGSCSVEGCQFEVEVNANAAPGQTCDFEIFRAGSVVKACSASSTCKYDGPAGELLSCGGTLVYTVRVGGARVSSREVHCQMCQ
jgi:hypothetical protein